MSASQSCEKRVVSTSAARHSRDAERTPGALCGALRSVVFASPAFEKRAVFVERQTAPRRSGSPRQGPEPNAVHALPALLTGTGSAAPGRPRGDLRCVQHGRGLLPTEVPRGRGACFPGQDAPQAPRQPSRTKAPLALAVRELAAVNRAGCSCAGTVWEVDV